MTFAKIFWRKGTSEKFIQGTQQFDRERPAVNLSLLLTKQYAAIMKQLIDLLPDVQQEEKQSELIDLWRHQQKYPLVDELHPRIPRRLFSDPSDPDHIVSCKRIKQQYKILCDIMDDTESRYYWRRARYVADHVYWKVLASKLREISELRFIFSYLQRKCRRYLDLLTERLDLKFREVMDPPWTKNGKTTELAATSLYMTSSRRWRRPEVYFIATKKDQANKIF